MKFTPWTERNKAELEARVYCKACNKSNVITAYNNAFFWSAFDERPVKIFYCDHCKNQMRIKITRSGLEYLL